MYLEIDQGNTRLKWRFQGSAMESGSLEHLHKKLKGHNTRLVRMVSVCSHQRRQHLINNIILRSPQPLEWRIARSSAECMQVHNAYTNPEQLGTDRWSALVAAATDHQKPGKAIAVLGCGSAITLDLADENKKHLGGSIAAGYRALQHGLRHTTNLHFDQLTNLSSRNPGTDTGQSVSWGINTMLAGFISQTVQYCRFKFRDDWQLIAHGGDAALLLPYIDDDVDADFFPELVLDGLKYLTDESTVAHHSLNQQP